VKRCRAARPRARRLAQIERLWFVESLQRVKVFDFGIGLLAAGYDDQTLAWVWMLAGAV